MGCHHKRKRWTALLKHDLIYCNVGTGKQTCVFTIRNLLYFTEDIKFKNKTSKREPHFKEKYEVATKKCGFPALKMKNAMLRQN
jgi:hypothetical protein